MSTLFSRAFQELHADVGDVLNEKESGDISPPGCEKNSKTFVPQYNYKYRPSRSVETVPKITKYVTTALCRQKLHSEVLEEWKSLFLDAGFNQLFASFCTMKKVSLPNGYMVSIGSFNILRNLSTDPFLVLQPSVPLILFQIHVITIYLFIFIFYSLGWESTEFV